MSSRRPERNGRWARLGSAGSNCASSPLPPDWRAIVAFELYVFAPPDSQPSIQPSAKANSTCPFSSIVTSLKSSRLRQGLLPPPFQIQALRCTGPFGVARAVVHVAPPSYVCATQPYHVPLKSTSW